MSPSSGWRHVLRHSATTQVQTTSRSARREVTLWRRYRWRLMSIEPVMVVMAVMTAAMMTSPVAADEVVLLDTTTESILEWKRFPSGPQSKTPGWVEESYTNFEKGINWRSYVVCDVAYQNVNNWLWTPFIERGQAERIYIELKFSMRDCSLFPGTALSCKETFSLLYYEFDAATREPPPWEPESYHLMDRIAADQGRSSSSHQQTINVETRSIEVTKKGVYFAIRDQGACISLLAVRVYYRTCPQTTRGLSHFAATPTARKESEIKSASGTCVANAVRRNRHQPPKFICKGDGEWKLLDAGCLCKPGYQADLSRQTCQACDKSQFKHAVGNDQCRACPVHSAATYTASTQCSCDSGFFRAPQDAPDMPCTQPPSAPHQLRVGHVQQTSAVLEWAAPRDPAGRPTDTRYRLTCARCDAAVRFEPAQADLNVTRVVVSGLAPAQQYRIVVYSSNGVSAVAFKQQQQQRQRSGGGQFSYETRSQHERSQFDQSAAIQFTTKSSVPSMVTAVRVAAVRSTEVLLEWSPPAVAAAATITGGSKSANGGGGGGDGDSSDGDGVVLQYEAVYFERGRRGNTSMALKVRSQRTHVTVSSLRQRTEYGFVVRALTAHGWGQASGVVYATTGQLIGTAFTGEDDSVNVRMIAGGTVAVITILVVIVVVGVYFVRSRSNEECNKKQPSDCDTLEYRNGEVHHPNSTSIIRTHTTGMTTPLYNPTIHQRTYIDPHTYEDPNQAIREFAREIDASHIIIEAVIGGGEFGDVCRGKLRCPGRSEITAAIKTLKPGSSEKARVDFLTEASIMGQFEHPNVIFLQGVVTRSNPVMIVTEFMENGSLDTFLRANDGKFQVLQLVAMLRGIAAGMQYLSEMSYVHRDLAARNVLVNTLLVCKIADFGLSREIEATLEGAYTTRGGKIPVRWTAPEAIAFRKFTSASDVWSFGVVGWEVMSYGERPYWNWSNQDVIKSIDKGYRLPAPMDCPEAMHQLMLDCWQKERAHRPSFSNIVSTLDNLISCPEALRKVAPNRNMNPLAVDAPDLTRIGSVDEWLASIKMSRYVDSLRRAGVDSMQAVTRLTHADLPALGITLVGHQKKIMNSVQALRAQIHANMSEAYFV